MKTLNEIKGEIIALEKNIDDHGVLFRYLDQLSPENRFEFIKTMQKSTKVTNNAKHKFYTMIGAPGKPIPAIPEKDLLYWFTLLLTQAPNFDIREATAILHRQMVELPFFLEKIATHLGKFVHPGAKPALCVPRSENPSRIPYITSQTINTATVPHNQFTFCGNGTMVNKARFLEAEFILNGRITNVFMGLCEKTPVILSALEKLGMSRKEADILSHLGRMQLPHASVTDDLPQMLWSVNGDYIAVTSLPSVGVLDKIRRSVWSLPEEQMIFTGDGHVGGSNSRNCGSYNLHIGGKHIHLISKVPYVTEKPLAWLLGPAYRTGTLLLANSTDFHFLKKKAGSHKGGERIKKNISHQVHKAWGGYRAIIAYLLENEELPKRYNDLPLCSLERRYVDTLGPGSSPRINRSDQEELAWKMMQTLKERFPPGVEQAYFRLMVEKIQDLIAKRG